jgi:hypothetical protein
MPVTCRKLVVKQKLILTGIGFSVALALVAVVGSRLTAAAPAAGVAAPAPSRSIEAAPPRMTSPETERLEARRVLYESVDALLQVSEYERARQLLDEDQARYGRDLAAPWRDLEQGYRLMADCLEHPSARARSRTEAFLLASEANAISAKLRQACARVK